MLENDYIDRDMLDSLTLVIGDRLLYIVDLFHCEGDKHIRQMYDAFHSNEAEVIRNSAHSLKSSSASYGLMLVSRISLSIETEMRLCIESGETWDHAYNYMPSLEKAFEQGVAYLRSHCDSVVA